MRIMVLGGIGWIGATLTKVLAEHPEVDEVIIGDIDDTKSHKLIEEIGGGVGFRKVDVYDHEALVQGMKDMDSVANALWYEFAIRAARAAIDARVPLTDLGAMPELTWKTPIFHPNVSSIGHIRLEQCGLQWEPDMTLDVVCERLWDLVRGAYVDVEKSTDYSAKKWFAEQTQVSLPVDPRPLRDRGLSVV